MKKKNISIAAGCLVATTLFSMTTAKVNAQGTTNKSSVNLPSAGIALALDNYNLENEDQKAQLSALVNDTVALSFEDAETETVQPETETEPQSTEEITTEQEPETKEPSLYDSVAMSQVNDYVNVRTEPNTDAEIVGKIYNNCAATILETVGDWYKIESGSVQGYIKSEYFITGDAAEAKALECRNIYATVTTETLNVREGQGTDCKCLTQLPEGGVFDVIQYGDGWVYLDVDGDVQGWVSMDYVDISVKFDTAISLEEEKAKLAEEARLKAEAEAAEKAAKQAKKEQEAAAKKAAEAKKKAKTSSESKATESKTSVQESENTGSSSAVRNAVVAYALQFVGNPYVYGGTSLTKGTDCSGFTMSVYSHFGYGLSRTSSEQSYNGKRVSTSSLLPGDLLFYTNGGSGIGHVALYIGNGQVVHASTPSTGIKISSAFYRTPLCAVRIIN